MVVCMYAAAAHGVDGVEVFVLEVGEGVPYDGVYAAAAHGVGDVEVFVCVVVVVCCDVVLVFGGGLLSVVDAGGGRMRYDLISVCRAVVVVG